MRVVRCARNAVVARGAPVAAFAHRRRVGGLSLDSDHLSQVFDVAFVIVDVDLIVDPERRG